MPFRSLWADPVRREADELTAILSEGEGIVAGLAQFGEGTSGLRLELVLLPLRHRGARAGRMLGAMSPFAPLAANGPEPVGGLTTDSLRVIRLDRPPHDPPAQGKSAGSDRPRPRFVLLDGGLSARSEPAHSAGP